MAKHKVGSLSRVGKKEFHVGLSNEEVFNVYVTGVAKNGYFVCTCSFTNNMSTCCSWHANVKNVQSYIKRVVKHEQQVK